MVHRRLVNQGTGTSQTVRYVNAMDTVNAWVIHRFAKNVRIVQQAILVKPVWTVTSVMLPMEVLVDRACATTRPPLAIRLLEIVIVRLKA